MNAKINAVQIGYGYTIGNVRTLFAMFTKKFWKLQWWMLRWIFTGDFIDTFKEGDTAEFIKATKAASGFLGVANLAGKLLK